jgi:SPP1 family predicted phage head-tail adaptor
MTSPKVGELRHRITIERPVRTDDEGGAASVTWLPVATLWARIEGRGGREGLSGDGETARAVNRITLRYRPDVGPSMRILAAGEVFDIISAQDEEGRRRWLVCYCEAYGQ